MATPSTSSSSGEALFMGSLKKDDPIEGEVHIPKLYSFILQINKPLNIDYNDVKKLFNPNQAIDGVEEGDIQIIQMNNKAPAFWVESDLYNGFNFVCKRFGFQFADATKEIKGDARFMRKANPKSLNKGHEWTFYRYNFAVDAVESHFSGQYCLLTQWAGKGRPVTVARDGKKEIQMLANRNDPEIRENIPSGRASTDSGMSKEAIKRTVPLNPEEEKDHDMRGYITEEHKRRGDGGSTESQVST